MHNSFISGIFTEIPTKFQLQAALNEAERFLALGIHTVILILTHRLDYLSERNILSTNLGNTRTLFMWKAGHKITKHPFVPNGVKIHLLK